MAEPLSIAGSIAGLISLGNEVFRLVYRYTTAVKNAEKEIGDLKRELEALNGVLHNVDIIARELEQDHLRKPAVRLDHVNSCLALLHQLKKKLGELKITAPSKIEKSFCKLTWPFKSSETQAIVAEIRACRDTIAIALSADSFYTLLKSLSLQENIEDELAAVHRLLHKRNEIEDRIHLDEKRTKILKNYLFVDVKQSFSINTKLRYPTTGFWLTADPAFQSWLNGNASCLWLSGIPGAGKTVLSTLVIEDCIKRSGAGRAVAYFYCDYKDKNSQDPVKLLGTLASQIARQAPEAFDLLERYHERWNHENSLRVNPDAKNLLSLLEEMICVFDDVRLVVDALDECGDNTRLISNLLKELASLDGANASIALFSRDEADIRDVLAPPFSKHVEIAAHTEDVEHYARADIENRILEKKLRVKTPELKEEIVRHLVEKADGMFRWVTCQLDFLSEFINERQIRRSLPELPTGLDETYRRLLQRIKPAARFMVRRVLHWTIAHPDRLSISELIDAMAIDIEAGSIDEDSKVDEDTLRRECSSLLRYVSGNQPEIAHFTVQEYLEKIDINDPEIGKFKIVESAARVTITRVFLSYICSPQFERKPPITLDEQKNHDKEFPLYKKAVYCLICDLIYQEDEEIYRFLCLLFDPVKTYNFITFMVEYTFFHIYENLGDESIRERIMGILLSGSFRPLHAAAMIRLPNICKYLVRQGCDVNHLSSLGTPLQFAANGVFLFYETPHTTTICEFGVEPAETITVLIESGAACQLRHEGEICSLTLFAYLNDDIERTTFRDLLKYGLQISKDLLSWVESAPEREKKAFFRVLSEAALDHLSKETKFALLQIANKSRIIVPKSLLDRYSSETQQVSDEGFRNLVFKAIQFDQPEKLKELVKDARFWERIDSYGHGGNHLHSAAKSGSVQALKVLLDSSPSEELTMEELNGMTVWHWAARYGTQKMLETLVDEFSNEAKGLTSESGVGTSPFTEAIKAGHEQTALYLIDLVGTALEKPGNSPLLHLATTMGMSQAVQKLAENGFDPKVTSTDGSNALFFVTSKTTVRTVEILLDLGLDPKESRSDGKTPLHAALGVRPESILGSDFQPRFAGDKVIEKLISNDVIHMPDQDGNDPWYYYCTKYLQESGLTESCVVLGKTLINHGCLEAHEKVKSMSALSLLVQSCYDITSNNKSINDTALLVEWVLDRRPQQWDLFLGSSQATRLLCSCILNNLPLVNGLLEKGADVHTRCMYSKISALEIAASVYVEEHIFEKILQHSDASRLNEGDETGSRIIHHLCMCKDSQENLAPEQVKRSIAKVEKLIEYAVDVNAATHTGYTACLIAAECGFTEAIEILVDHGADIMKVTTSGMNVLAATATNGSLRSLQKLYHLKLTIEWTDTFHFNTGVFTYLIFQDGQPECNILHTTATHRNGHSFKYLVSIPELFSRLDDPNGFGFTPLHFAAAGGCTDTVQYLLDNGAKVNTLSWKGKIPPLHFAIIHGHAEIFSLLVNAGATLQSNGLGQSLEELRIFDNRKIERMKKLIQEARSQKAKSTEVYHTESQSMSLEEFEECIRHDDSETCKGYIETNDLNNSKLSCGCNPLFYALAFGGSNIVMELLNGGASTSGEPCHVHLDQFPFLSRFHQFAAVSLAVYFPSFNSRLSTLLDKSLEFPNHWAWGPLNIFYLATRYNPGAIDIIISHIHKQWEWYRQFLPKGSNEDSSSVARYFLEGRNFSSPILSSNANIDGITPLMKAVELRKPKVVQTLLNHGATPFSRGYFQCTALHIAAMSGCVDSASLLIAAGARPSERDMYMQTSLMVACGKGNIEVALFLEKYEPRNLVDALGKSALHHAATKQPSIFSTLVDLGWDPFLEDDEDCTPVHLGLRSKPVQTLVLNSGFDVTKLDATSKKGEIPFFPVSTPQILRMLLKRLPPSLVANVFRNKGPLFQAARANDTEVMEVVIKAGADVESPNDHYGLALVGASRSGSLEAVKMLVRSGARPWLYCNKQALNAVQAAVLNYREEIVQWLLIGRYTDQNKLTDVAEYGECEVKLWSGIRCLCIPIVNEYKRRSEQSLWEYLLVIEEAKKEWRKMVPLTRMKDIALV